MAIKITNQSTGRKIIVKNQDDMLNLKNTGQSFDFDVPDTDRDDFLSTFDLSKFNDADIEDYINRFSFDGDASSDNSADDPLNPTHDPYFDFGSDEKYTQDNFPDAFQDEDDFDINDTSDFNSNEPDQEQEFNIDDENTEPTEEDSDSDFQGQIRAVTGAVLVYKRQQQDGTYDELWMYTVGKDMKSEYAIRKAILSGTEIDPNTQESDDGSQRVFTISRGNVQFISITGLPQ